MDDLTHAGTPSLCSAGPTASCGIISNAFVMSSCTTVMPFLVFASLSNSSSVWTLLKHPGSGTNPFWRGENVVVSRSL